MRARWVDIVRLRLRTLFRRPRVESELEKELRFHLEAEIEELCERGVGYEEAYFTALRHLGGISQIQEECRDMRRTSWMDALWQDLRYAVRMLRANPGFTIVMLATLALSIGATSAIVSVVNGVLFRALPFQEPERLVRIFPTNKAFPKFAVNPNDFHDFRDRLRGFESMAAYTHVDHQIAGVGVPVKLRGFAVTAGFFHVLGLKPAVGREFERNDELAGHQHSVIVSDHIWRTLLGAQRDAVGKSIELDAEPYTVVGVMPAGVQHPGNMYHAVLYGEAVDFWVPFTFDQPKDRGSHYLDAVARLNPGVSIGEAGGEINAAMMQILKEHDYVGTDPWRILLIPLSTEIVGRSERMLYVLLGAVALVLLLACLNAANLLLARAVSRQREMALRSALGAARTRVIRQLLTESVLLAVVGAGLGIALAFAGVRALVANLPPDFPRSGDIHLDLRVLLFTMLVAVLTGVLFGIVPAWHASRVDLRESLHESSRTSTGSGKTLRLRHGLVISEVALACALLAGAGLMLRTFVNLLRADPGFRPEHTVTAEIALPSASYQKRPDVDLFLTRLLERLRDVPGVEAAGVGSDLPWTGWDDNAGFGVDGEESPREGFHARYHMASPGYFKALGIPLVAGRDFDDHDNPKSRSVIVINEAMARYWQRHNALGSRITFSDKPAENDWLTVVGIVRDVKDTPKSASAEPSFWWSSHQSPFRSMVVTIRSRLEMEKVANHLRAAVAALDGSLAVSNIRSMDAVAAAAYASTRFTFAMVALFALLALVLAAIGTYGVMAYWVNQRIVEFGIRMALGARPLDVMRSVLSSGMKLALGGTLLGLAIGVLLARLLGNLLYGVGPRDPVAFGLTCVVTLVAAALACYIPALRATRQDPMQALRAD
ncbi:MAG: ABC transporter permease [Acidobacteriaceae bacterium]|nr:ABC transporter permease [Acidobacteriaceae bacterium]